MNKQDVIEWIEANRSQFIDLAQEIWENPEVSFKEFKSSNFQAQFLEKLGWKITWDLGGLNTAFMAEWGEGKPVLGFIGEFDALPGLSQKLLPDPEPIEGLDAGHGCGHNLLGVGCLAAAVAFREWLEKSGNKATVRYYGCPAEEDGNGKVVIGSAGYFKDLDAAFNYHPGSMNKPAKGSSLAVNDLHLRFHGVSSHAGGSPHLGRSALDAIELTHVGINYLREHVTSNIRMHYIITHGGQAPNIVPDFAEDWLYLRAPNRKELNEVTDRVIKIAEGAAMMTDTGLEVDMKSGSTNILNNHYLADMHYDNLEVIGPIEYTEEELAFAARINSHFPKENVDNFYKRLGAPEGKEAELEALKGQPVIGLNFPANDENKIGGGSTDVGDLSWMVPLTMMSTTCNSTGAPGHSWAVTATSGMSIGHKGMLHAAKAMALTAIDIIEDPAHLQKIRGEFEKRTAEMPYTFPTPDQIKKPDYFNPVRNTK